MAARYPTGRERHPRIGQGRPPAKRAGPVAVIRRLPILPGDPPLVPGRAYHRRVRGLPGLPLIRISAVREQRLRDVTHEQAQTEEGYDGRRALQRFRYDWVRRHDRWARLHPQASDAELNDRWRRYHANRLVLVVTFDVVDPVRNLPEQRDVLAEVARRGARANTTGRADADASEYVTSGGIDHLEAVDPSTLAGYVADALTARLAARAGLRVDKRERRRSRVIRYRPDRP